MHRSAYREAVVKHGTKAIQAAGIKRTNSGAGVMLTTITSTIKIIISTAGAVRTHLTSSGIRRLIARTTSSTKKPIRALTKQSENRHQVAHSGRREAPNRAVVGTAPGSRRLPI